MRKLKSALLCSLICALSGCGATTSGSVGRSVVIGGANVTWKDYQKLSGQEFDTLSFAPGESVYLFTAFAGASVDLGGGKSASSLSDCVRHSSSYAATVPVVNHGKLNACKARLAAAREQKNQRSFPEFLSLAERAVEQEGSCSWEGYDRSFDQGVRALTSAARFDDEGLFFAKMTCAN